MKVRDRYDIMIEQGLADGEPVEEVLRDVIKEKARKRQMAKVSRAAGVDNRTLSRFGRDDTVSLSYDTMVWTWAALGYRLTVERI